MSDIFLQDAPQANDDLLRRISTQGAVFSELEEQIEATEEIVKTLKERKRVLETDTLPGLFLEAGLTRIDMPDGSVIAIEDFINGAIPKDEREGQCLTWLEGNGLEFLVQNSVSAKFDKGDNETVDKVITALESNGVDYDRKMFVHPQSLKKQMREMYEQTGQRFPDCFSPYYGHTTKIKRPKA